MGKSHLKQVARTFIQYLRTSYGSASSADVVLRFAVLQTYQATRYPIDYLRVSCDSFQSCVKRIPLIEHVMSLRVDETIFLCHKAERKYRTFNSALHVIRPINSGLCNIFLPSIYRSVKFFGTLHHYQPLPLFNSSMLKQNFSNHDHVVCDGSVCWTFLVRSSFSLFMKTGYLFLVLVAHLCFRSSKKGKSIHLKLFRFGALYLS